MYSDIIPPKKSIRKIETSKKIKRIEKHDIAEEKAAEAFTPYKKTYHTVDGRDVQSKVPFIFFALAIVIVGGIMYSKYNHTTTLTFSPKTTTFEVKEKITLVGAGDPASKDISALPYSLVYIPSDDVNNLSSSTSQNPFNTQKTATTTATTTSTAKEYTMTASTTRDVKKITFVNKTSLPISLRETTRISAGDVVYTLDKAVTIQPTPQAGEATGAVFHVVGFKDTTDYEKVYAIPTGSVNTGEKIAVGTTTDEDGPVSAVPPTNIISLLPETSLPLLKSNIYDRVLDQNAVVVLEQRDLENVLQKINPAMQEYVKTLNPIIDIVKYHISIIDYDLEVSNSSGRPIGFKSLTIEVTPRINIESSKRAFAEFSSEAMKKIQDQIAPYVKLDISNFPFWMTSVPEADMVRVETEPIAK